MHSLTLNFLRARHSEILPRPFTLSLSKGAGRIYACLIVLKAIFDD